MIEGGQRLRRDGDITAGDRADRRQDAAGHATPRVVTRIMVLDAVLGHGSPPFLSNDRRLLWRKSELCSAKREEPSSTMPGSLYSNEGNKCDGAGSSIAQTPVCDD